MAAPLFVLQLVDTQTGKVAQWYGGEPLEIDLLQQIRDKGVGLMRTENHVIADVIAVLREFTAHSRKLV